MLPDSLNTVNGAVPADKKAWANAFMAYAAIEALFLMITYLITRSRCASCVQPLAFYIIQFSAAVLLTAFLWRSLAFISRQRHWAQIAGNLLVAVLYYFLWTGFLYVLFNAGITWLSGQGGRPYNDIIYWSWFDIGRFLVIAASFYMLKFYFSYRKAAAQRIELAVINKDLQVNLLKQQLSPHFYFNTLNNLYGLARTDDTRLPAALDQLANIMQYVIADCNHPRVLLSQEINFLESYIELERLRYESNTPIEMNVNGKVNGQWLQPLLLIQFVENAFKHGMKEKSEKNWLKVNMDVQGNDLLFRVDNSFYGEAPSQGIGISSVQHILDLQYKQRHDLQMSHGENSFSVTLKLNLL